MNLVGVDFVEKRPLEGSRKQVVQLAHRDAFAELVELQHPVAVVVVRLTDGIETVHKEDKAVQGGCDGSVRTRFAG